MMQRACTWGNGITLEVSKFVRYKCPLSTGSSMDYFSGKALVRWVNGITMHVRVYHTAMRTSLSASSGKGRACGRYSPEGCYMIGGTLKVRPMIELADGMLTSSCRTRYLEGFICKEPSRTLTARSGAEEKEECDNLRGRSVDAGSRMSSLAAQLSASLPLAPSPSSSLISESRSKGTSRDNRRRLAGESWL